MTRPYRTWVVVDGIEHEIHRDVCHLHPPEVHTAMGTASESALQRALDGAHVPDFYDDRGTWLGPDCNGFAMRYIDEPGPEDA